MNKKVALQIRNTEPLEKMVKVMSESGFKYVAMAFSDEKPFLNTNWEKYVYDIGELFSKYGLNCIQTHAPYYNLLISAEKRDEDMETALLRTIKATKMLGAEICAVHPRSVIIDGESRETAVDRQRSLQENLIAFSPLTEQCEKDGVLLGIENLMKYPKLYPYFYSWIVEDHCELIDRLGSKNVAAIWDFGHANLVDTDHAKRIQTLGNRIKGTHVHNNGANDDEHMPPFLPPSDSYYVRRTIDWNKVLSALKSTGYNGFLTLETVFNFSYPIDSYIRYLYESVCELENIFQEEI